jgi:Flp pilus assembly protein CpaB
MYRLRFFLRRFPAAYWLAAFLVAALTATTVARLVGRAEAAAARYGSPRVVWVMRRPVPAGAALSADDVARRPVPAAFVPSGAVGSAVDLAGRTAVAPLARGEVVLAARLAGAGVGGVAALLPAGATALAVPVGPGTPPVRRGDRVDVLATFDAGDGPAGAEPTFAVARSAPVLAVSGDKSVTVALSPEEAPRVAFAIAKATVTLALTNG